MALHATEMTLAIKIDWSAGVVYAGPSAIQVGSSGELFPAIASLCQSSETTLQRKVRYRFSRKVSLLGHLADCVVDVAGKVDSVTLLFERIEFFDARVMESRIVKAVEANAQARFGNPHPAVALLDSLPWGEARFTYDSKQGHLNLSLQFK